MTGGRGRRPRGRVLRVDPRWRDAGLRRAEAGSRYGYSTVIGGTRDLSRTLVYSVNSTDAKGPDMNAVGYGVIGAAFAK
ncbi:hypothetical protein ACFYZT_22435 [Streptomyces sp. NPDC001591]|uniref:hypothetical protein n=1 Tax=Streptomyces sp. NPDC001591 TaxID=3364589 RepID=UPI00369C2797